MGSIVNERVYEEGDQQKTHSDVGRLNEFLEEP